MDGHTKSAPLSGPPVGKEDRRGVEPERLPGMLVAGATAEKDAPFQVGTFSHLMNRDALCRTTFIMLNHGTFSKEWYSA